MDSVAFVSIIVFNFNINNGKYALLSLDRYKKCMILKILGLFFLSINMNVIIFG